MTKAPHRLRCRRTESKEYTKNTPLIPANAASTAGAQPVVDGAGPNRIECCCAPEHRLLYVECVEVTMLVEHHHTLYSADHCTSEYRYIYIYIDIAEHGRLAVRVHLPIPSGLGAALTTAGRCIHCSTSLLLERINH